jgi:DNA repair protein RadD
MTIELSPTDRTNAIAQIKRRITPRDLRAVLDEMQGGRVRRRRKGVEWIVAETEGSGRRLQSRLPDDELAELLVDLGGVDLLSSRELRYRLARGTSADELDSLHEYPSGTRGRGGRESNVKAVANRNWHPGREWPIHFTRTLGFSPVFAGVRGLPSPPPNEDVEPFLPLPPLEDFQTDLKNQVMQVLQGRPSENRGILTLPTGAGKTRTAVEGILEWKRTSPDPSGVLWIAQSDELCEQAIQAFREVWIDFGHRDSSVRNTLTLSRFWGVTNKIPDGEGIVVASIQKLHSIYRNRGRTELSSDVAEMVANLRLVIVDEAHRMLAPSYTEVLRFLGVEVTRTGSSAIPLIGLTATPFRAQEEETRLLARRFHGRLLRPECLGADPIETLRQRGVLSKPTHQILDYTGREFSIDESSEYQEYFERFGDFHPKLLREIGEERDRNRSILDKLSSMPVNFPILFFGCSVDHAQAVAVLLRRRNRSAAMVTSDTRASTRRFLIEEFRSGRISVLCNYGVLTTGFDAPKVRAIVVARPTTSSVLYEQMIGRGLRGQRFGGTAECLIVDVVDNIRFSGQLAFSRYQEYWTKPRE